MSRGPPGPRRSGVRRHRGVHVGLVLEGEDVGKRRGVGACRSSRTPALRIPGHHVPVGVGGRRDLGVRRGTRAGDADLLVPVEHQLHRAAGVLRELGADDAPAVHAELAAEAAAHVLGLDVDVRGRNADLLAELRSDAGNRLGGGPERDRLFVLPLGDLAVGLEGAVGDLRHVVGAARLRRGRGHRGRRVPGGLRLRGLGVRSLVHRALVHEVRQHLVFDLHGGRAVAGDLLRGGGHRHDLVVGPLDLGPHVLDHVDPDHPVHRLRRRSVDGGDARVGVRALDHDRPEHPAAVHVVGVLRPSGRLDRAVKAANVFADVQAVACGGPDILSHWWFLLRPPGRRPPGCRRRCRSGRGCRRAPGGRCPDRDSDDGSGAPRWRPRNPACRNRTAGRRGPRTPAGWGACSPAIRDLQRW